MNFKEWIKLREDTPARRTVFGGERVPVARTTGRSSTFYAPPETLGPYLTAKGYPYLGGLARTVGDISGGYWTTMMQDYTQKHGGTMAPLYLVYGRGGYNERTKEFTLTTKKTERPEGMKDEDFKKLMELKKKQVIQTAMQTKDVQRLVKSQEIDPQYAHAVGPEPDSSNPELEIWHVKFRPYDPNLRKLGYYNIDQEAETEA